MLPTIQLQRPPALEFVCEDGRSFIVSPVTRARLEAAHAYAPTPEAEVTLAQDSERRGQVLAALVGARILVSGLGEREPREAPAAELLADLTAQEEMRMILALRTHAEGMNAAECVAIHELLKLQALLDHALAGQEQEAAKA